MKITLQRTDVIYGGLIYLLGDTSAAILLGEFGWLRLLGITFIGATLYAIEVPAYFRWIDKTVTAETGFFPKLKKTVLAILYFNPIWIARHLLFIKLLSLQFDQINFGLLNIALLSFLGTIPVGILGNYVIQNLIKIDWRYIASCIFSALMAIYYALSATLFS